MITGVLLALVLAAPAGKPINVVTDNDGRLTVADIAVGKVSIHAELTGYFAPEVHGSYRDSVDTSVVVKDDETASVWILMVPSGTVSGKVFESAGDFPT